MTTAQLDKPGRAVSATTAAVRAVILAAGPAGASSATIIARTGLPEADVKKSIQNQIGARWAINIGTHIHHAIYRRRTAADDVAATSSAERSRINPHHYQGRELAPFAARPGAMVAFALPSRRGNTLDVPRLVRDGKLSDAGEVLA